MQIGVAGGGPLRGRQQAARLIQADRLGGHAHTPGGLADGENLRWNVCLLRGGA